MYQLCARRVDLLEEVNGLARQRGLHLQDAVLDGAQHACVRGTNFQEEQVQDCLSKVESDFSPQFVVLNPSGAK